MTYGGVFDLYYKLEALKNIGAEVHLHCVQYGDNQLQPQLEKVSHQVYYYPRKKSFSIVFGEKPYIVSSRVIPEMIERLNQDNAPILLEGIHSTGIIDHLNSRTRKLLVRLHNVEYVYYDALAKTTNNPFKKLYYRAESIRLKKWESTLVKKEVPFAAVSILDQKIYENQLGCKLVSYIPLFIPDWKMATPTGVGKYCLYQGNLDVEENQEAVKWLATEVFSELSIPLHIAGKSTSDFVKKMKSIHPNIVWFENPSNTEMQQLIADAQIHLLPSFNATGIKIKLLNALYNGRFCLTNIAMVKDSGMEELCIVADTAEDFRENIVSYFVLNFPESEQQKRKDLLAAIYDNNKNAMHLKQQLFDA